MKVRLLVAVMAAMALTACGSKAPTAPECDTPTQPAQQKLLEFVVTKLQPAGPAVVTTPFIAEIEGTALLDASMLPAWAGVVYVEGDGSNCVTHWSTIGYVDPQYGPPDQYSTPYKFTQEFSALDYGKDGEYCTSYQLCKDYLPGKTINAYFFIGKKGVDVTHWDSRTGHVYIDWDRVAYRQFIRIGYTFR